MSHSSRAITTTTGLDTEYFWESNPLRGYEFAAELKSKRQRMDRPYVVGAAIDLGYCLDLLSTSGIQAVQAGYDSFCQMVAASGAKLPVNASGHDLLLRKLDCAVVNHIHGSMKQGRAPGIRHRAGRIHRRRSAVREFRLLPQNSHPDLRLQSALHNKVSFVYPGNSSPNLGLTELVVRRCPHSGPNGWINWQRSGSPVSQVDGAAVIGKSSIPV